MQILHAVHGFIPEFVGGTERYVNALARAQHEAGHGVICKRFGGVVPEFGFMLLVLFPAPYVDA